MEQNFKKLLASLRPRDTRELVADHVRRVVLNPVDRTATLHVDKRYAFNTIVAHGHIEQVIRAVKKAFGEGFGTVVSLESLNAHSDREKAVPHAIHYR